MSNSDPIHYGPLAAAVTESFERDYERIMGKPADGFTLDDFEEFMRRLNEI